MAQSQHFSPDDFTPTKFSTAEQKAIFGNQLLAFVAAGLPEKKFTNALYERLSNCYGFIAHMNRNGFFKTFFTCTADQLRFIQALAKAPCYGDPNPRSLNPLCTRSNVAWLFSKNHGCGKNSITRGCAFSSANGPMSCGTKRRRRPAESAISEGAQIIWRCYWA